MPKISELDSDQPLTGAELIAIVQDGETRKAPLSDLLNAPRTVRLDHARWVHCTTDHTVINDAHLHISINTQGI